MSRAFMKEGEAPEPRCPSCATLGGEVGATTLAVHVPLDLRAALGERAYYCVNPGCRTAYFSGWGGTVPADRITGSAWPKDPTGPLCSCTGLTAGDIEADAREGRKDRIRSLKERAETSPARCTECSPEGQSCLPRALRLFRESFQAR